MPQCVFVNEQKESTFKSKEVCTTKKTTDGDLQNVPQICLKNWIIIEEAVLFHTYLDYKGNNI